MKKDTPYDWFIGFQLIDENDNIILNIDGAPSNKEWMTQHLTFEEEIIGVYGK